MNKRQSEVLDYQRKSEEQVLKDLKKVYKKALDDIDDEIAKLKGREENETENLQSIIYQKQYQQALKQQINGILDTMNAQQFTTISDYLAKSYESSFVGTMYDLHGQGIPLVIPINQNQVVQAVQVDSKLSKSLYETLGEDVNLLKTRVRSNIARGFASGQSYSMIAKNISSGMVGDYSKMNGGSLAKAYRITRTEGHRIQQQAADDVRQTAKSKGADIVKQWDSTLDGRTRDSHRSVDGEIRELDEKFSNGLLFPGHKDGIASEVVNCRCACLQRARWGLDEEELQILKDRAEYYGLDKTENFEEFQEKYLEASKTVSVKQRVEFVPARTIKEAEEFAKQFFDTSAFGSVGVSFQGVGLDVANEINQGLATFFDTFDVDKLGGLSAPAKNTKLGKQVDATMAYSPIRKSILLNRENTKNLSVFDQSLLADRTALDSLLNNPERYDWSKLSNRVKAVVENSKVSGRATVPETVQESLFHELGHFLEDGMSKEEYAELTKNMDKFGTSISGYACESRSEYIAESFASYMKGEEVIDPTLRKYFDGLRKIV